MSHCHGTQACKQLELNETSGTGGFHGFTHMYHIHQTLTPGNHCGGLGLGNVR